MALNESINKCNSIGHILILSGRPSEAAPVTSGTAEPSSLPRVSSRSYDLQERRRTGNMTGTEQAKYQRIPTDEFEARTLASADLDGIKSEFFY